MNNRTTHHKITRLKDNEIFVFGSNNLGEHIGGAAKTAADKFGAIMGNGVGIQGKSYAIPTLEFSQTKSGHTAKLELSNIASSVFTFINYAKENTDKTFLVTEIGCGIAGFTHEEIAPLFSRAKDVDNIHLPEAFWKIINEQVKTVKGYKIFNPDLTCRGFQYEIGKEYKHEGHFRVCNNGFHFCLKASDCFNYYNFDPKNVVCEVEALGEIQSHSDDSKIATNHIKIIRQLTWEEVLFVANEGTNNTGHSNSGNSNSGDRNSGDSNSGYRNSGNWNSGDRNSGDSNSGYRNSGAFCTDTNPVLLLFNKPSKMTVLEWENHRCYQLMMNIDTTIWVPFSHMTNEEKEKNPKAETTEGFLRIIPMKEAWSNAWNNFSENDKKLFTSLENFDSAIFFEITGIKVD